MSRNDDPTENESRLSRRDFLRYGAVGGAAAAAAPGRLLAGDGAPAPAGSNTAAREGARRGDRSSMAGPSGPRPPHRELETATVTELQEAMEEGKLTSRDLVMKCVERIEALDRRGPELRNMLEVNPEAGSVAARLEAEREERGPRGPLHGIPVVLKDNVDTADRMETAAGSLALAGTTPDRDAFLAGRLREAGAVILGKANLSEWANFRSSESSSGWSARGGQGRNPYAVDRTPCGSSSGSAAAVAAAYAPVAVGTETNGSIMCPSSACSVVGIKPTVGLVSRSGVIPISHTQDTAGPMGKSVADAAHLLGAMAGVDPRDSATKAARDHLHADYTRFLDPEGLKGARLGVPRGSLSGFTEETDRLFDDALRMLEEVGAELVDPADVPHAGEYGDAEYTVLLYEFKAGIDAYLGNRGETGGPESLEDLIRFNEENAAREMPWFGQDIFERAQEKGSLEEEEYRDAVEKILRLSRREGVDKVMEEKDLDAMVALTSGPPWPVDLVNGDCGHGSSYSTWAIAGYPSITVPAGYAFGLPVGLSFYGRAWEEPKIIRYAYAFEQAAAARKPPTYRRTDEVAGA